ncbi:hypothetical protein Q8F55_004203 [Vanrija albida]|uniref:MHYT domain-containing protein n=1 Tax=Vanrija albida TaxID=181172 RepID=A0ABR3Q633_9TREE
MRPSPVASSSRLPIPPPPRAPPAQARRRLRRRAAVLAFALAAPQLALASPVLHRPDGAPGHDPSTRDPPDGFLDSAVLFGLQFLQGVARSAGDLWHGHAAHEKRHWANIDVVRYSAPGRIAMPGGHFELRQRMNAGFVVLSYLISLVGSLCTLELLIRRTSNRGVSNIVLLAAAGICFGAVSTFAMHFVGNQSLSLHHPESHDFPILYLSYSGGYTVLSLVASCSAMTLAFFIMGTNIRFREWRTWPWVPGSSERRRREGLMPRDDYARWKLQKSKIRKSANVSTIFAQAGMVASWSLMESPRAQRTPRGWRDLFRVGGPSTPESAVDTVDTVSITSLGDDEDDIVKRDKELGELDFRLGRSAVREEMERRQMRADSPQSEETPTQSTETSISLPPALAVSPLAAYYPTTAPRPETQAPRDDEKGMEVFAPGYSFPPRFGAVDNDSTTHLIPRTDPVAERSWQAAINAQPVAPIYLPSTAPVVAARRASLPAISPLPPSRPAVTLSRIQSLPEEQPVAQLPAVQHVKGAASHHSSTHSSEGGKEDPNNRGSSSDETMSTNQFARLENIAYDEEADNIKPMSWRETLRSKLQQGIPLTRLEMVERFLGLDVVTWGDVIKIAVTGMIAGWGVAGMHYIGQVSINDIPYIAYRVGYVVGSVIIASGAVIIALYIMFIMLRPKLKHSWISKIGVAVILAGAVCGMHYTGMKGTIYGWPRDRSPNNASAMSGTKRAITGLVSALAFAACIGVASFVGINSIRDRKERARRRRVVVASILIDDQDRILVSAIDGVLPMCDIASLTPTDAIGKKKGKRYHRRAPSVISSSGESSVLGVDLTTGNEAFVQAMKMSWSWRNPFWSSLNPYASRSDLDGGVGNSPFAQLVPSEGLKDGPLKDAPPHVPHRSSVATAAESTISSVVPRLSIARFLEKFAVSATQLSMRLTGQQDGISRLGVLYDRILTTGWVRLPNGDATVSKGQLIFLVRRVTSSQERSDLLSRHFIFAEPNAVAMALHKTLSAPYDHVMPMLEDMKTFCEGTMRMSLRANTLYAGVAIVQATPFDGLRILLNQGNRSQLPMREVCTFSTLPGLPVNVAEGLAGTLEEIGEAVTWLEGMSLLSVVTRNMSPENTRVGGPRVGRLLAALERAVVPMLDQLLSQDDMAYILPRLTLHPVLVPLTPAAPPRIGTPGWAAPHVVVFYANYDVAVNSFADKWLPFSLFRAQHECVMAPKIDGINRAIEAAAVRSPAPPTPSPGVSPMLSAVSPDPSKYHYARRPSKVQFEVPAESGLATYTFPPKEGGGGGGAATLSPPPPLSPTAVVTGSAAPFPFSSRDRAPPRRSSLAKTLMRDDGEYGRPSRDMRTPGIATWDPNWLVHLLRTRLRADA